MDDCHSSGRRSSPCSLEDVTSTWKAHARCMGFPVPEPPWHSRRGRERSTAMSFSVPEYRVRTHWMNPAYNIAASDRPLVSGAASQPLPVALSASNVGVPVPLHRYGALLVGVLLSSNSYSFHGQKMYSPPWQRQERPRSLGEPLTSHSTPCRARHVLEAVHQSYRRSKPLPNWA